MYMGVVIVQECIGSKGADLPRKASLFNTTTGSYRDGN